MMACWDQFRLSCLMEQKSKGTSFKEAKMLFVLVEREWEDPGVCWAAPANLTDYWM